MLKRDGKENVSSLPLANQTIRGFQRHRWPVLSRLSSNDWFDMRCLRDCNRSQRSFPDIPFDDQHRKKRWCLNGCYQATRPNSRACSEGPVPVRCVRCDARAGHRHDRQERAETGPLHRQHPKRWRPWVVGSELPCGDAAICSISSRSERPLSLSRLDPVALAANDRNPPFVTMALTRVNRW